MSDISDLSRAEKSADAFRTITEVADLLDIQQHVLRFWETKFTHIKPMKRAGGRRYYRPEDVRLLQVIRRLLHEEGYTIRGVQKLLRDHGVKTVLDWGDEGASVPAPEPEITPAKPKVDVAGLQALRQELAEARDLLAVSDDVLPNAAKDPE
jgi:DNA-binding transcriptional MerR regulator